MIRLAWLGDLNGVYTLCFLDLYPLSGQVQEIHLMESRNNQAYNNCSSKPEKTFGNGQEAVLVFSVCGDRFR